jgi:uncharacterized membrane protein YbhN (UPF0104 family)
MKARIIVALVALPFGAFGGWIWRRGVASGDVFYYYDFLGSAAYSVFGFPLSSLVLRILFPLRFDQHWWAVPLLTGVVVIQWVLWAQAVFWFRDFRMRRPCK